MILIRRVLALLLVLVFPLVLLVSLTGLRINATVLQPGFYTETLQHADAYNFLYDQGIPLAITKSGVDLQKDLPLGLSLTPTQVSGYAKQVIPPTWLQQNVTNALDQLVPYLTGKTDSFSIHIRLDDRVTAAAAVLQDMVQQAQLRDYLDNQVVRPELENNPSVLQGLPFGLTVTVDQVVQGVDQVVPEDWLKQQASGAIDQVVPYIAGQSNTFNVVVPLQDRATAAVAVLRQWMLGNVGATRSYLLQDQIAPLVTTAFNGGAVHLPYGVTVTQADVVSAVGGAISDAWVTTQVNNAMDQLGPYITGQTDTLNIVIPLATVTADAATALAATVDSELEAGYNAAPTCSLLQAASFVTSSSLPDCQLAGVSYQQAKAMIGYDVPSVVKNDVAQAVPPSITLTQDSLFSGAELDEVNKVRTLLGNGYVFTESDLRNLLVDQGGQGMLTTFDDMRNYMANGVTFTQADLKDAAGADSAQLDSVRHTIGTARSLAFVLALVPILLAVIIGFLGGRSWWTRLAWAGAPLLVGGVIVAAASGVVAIPVRTLTDPLINGWNVDPAIIAEVVQVRDALLHSFLTPITVQAGVIAALGLSAIAGGLVLARRRAHASSQPR